MVFGYVLIKTKKSYEHVVAEKLSRIDEIVDVEPLLVEETAMAEPFFDEYEIIAKAEADNSNVLKNIVNDKIHTILGVEKTKIMLRQKV